MFICLKTRETISSLLKCNDLKESFIDGGISMLDLFTSIRFLSCSIQLLISRVGSSYKGNMFL